MTSFVVECFWIGVGDDDLRRIDKRPAAAVERLDSEEDRVRYHGSVLMRSDEVALCFFEGAAARVRRAAEAAAPFERILESASSPLAVKEQ
jgi:hypothetical protein